MRASLICNFPKGSAMDRSAAVMQESCPSPDSARRGIELGFVTFERERTKVGERRACSNWADFMIGLSR